MITILNQIVRRTRQHHAIEHATIHLLNERYANRRYSGLSDVMGFTIMGPVYEEELRQAVGNAMLRLQAGEAHLAIHPNCGTNLATAGVLATLIGMFFGSLRGSFMNRFGMALMLVLIALIQSRPLGYHLQKYTTLAHVADRWVVDVQPMTIFGQSAHRVTFE